MEERVQEFGTALATTAIARDWAGVHGMLAPWLRSSTDAAAVQAFFEDDYRETLHDNDVEGLHYPEVPYVSGNSSDLADLREPSSFAPAPRPIAAEVTDANFRQWMKIQLQCSDEQQEEFDFD